MMGKRSGREPRVEGLLNGDGEVGERDGGGYSNRLLVPFVVNCPLRLSSYAASLVLAPQLYPQHLLHFFQVFHFVNHLVKILQPGSGLI